MEQECYSCDWSEKPYIKISTLASAASRKSYIHDYILQKCRGAQIRKVALFPQQKAVPSMPPTDPSCCLTTFREGKAPPRPCPGQQAQPRQHTHPSLGPRAVWCCLLLLCREGRTTRALSSHLHSIQQDRTNCTKPSALDYRDSFKKTTTFTTMMKNTADFRCVFKKLSRGSVFRSCLKRYFPGVLCPTVHHHPSDLRF